MKALQLTIVIAFLVLVGSSTVTCQSAIIDSIAQSHIDDNVPDKKDFDNFLKRDLAEYFKVSTDKDTVIEYELLRKAPTQSGTSFPKFYAWVRVNVKGNLIEEGAIRLAAIDKKIFQITHYLKRADIESNTDEIYTVFPEPVGDKIKQKLKIP